MAREGNPFSRAMDLLEQCRATLEWQVGNGNIAVDFLYPKVVQAINLLTPKEEDDFLTESSTSEELEKIYSYDFVLPTDKYDEE